MNSADNLFDKHRYGYPNVDPFNQVRVTTEIPALNQNNAHSRPCRFQIVFCRFLLSVTRRIHGFLVFGHLIRVRQKNSKYQGEYNEKNGNWPSGHRRADNGR
ncbi:MAG: hypothetical protein ACI861_001985 [Paracoccaceae bacterium]|jgi:hypothetical protein